MPLGKQPPLKLPFFVPVSLLKVRLQPLIMNSHIFQKADLSGRKLEPKKITNNFNIPGGLLNKV